jgi:hypothetical protein
MYDKFWSRVKRTAKCWEWTGKCALKGYGKSYIFWYTHNEQLAHRTSWIIHKGKIPKGKHVLHHCDNPKCVRPSHLYLGTNADNVRDKVKRGRTGKEKRTGELSALSKVTEEQVKAMRKSSDTGVAWAKRLGITEAQVSRIRLRKCWKHI